MPEKVQSLRLPRWQEREEDQRGIDVSSLALLPNPVLAWECSHIRSAGGGGNSEFRKEKLQSKNAKLQEERQREREKREEIEAKQEERKKKKESKQKKGKKGDAGGESAAEPVKQSNEHGGIHPSRLAMMQAPAPPRSQSHRQRF